MADPNEFLMTAETQHDNRVDYSCSLRETSVEVKLFRSIRCSQWLSGGLYFVFAQARGYSEMMQDFLVMGGRTWFSVLLSIEDRASAEVTTAIQR